jgi:hypothetical protein
MTAFTIDLNTEQPDRIFVEVDRRFDVAIERTETGLALRVYPRTDGELWIEPFITFEVDESEIIALERELGADAVFGHAEAALRLADGEESQPTQGGQ